MLTVGHGVDDDGDKTVTINTISNDDEVSNIKEATDANGDSIEETNNCLISIQKNKKAIEIWLYSTSTNGTSYAGIGNELLLTSIETDDFEFSDLKCFIKVEGVGSAGEGQVKPIFKNISMTMNPFECLDQSTRTRDVTSYGLTGSTNFGHRTPFYQVDTMTYANANITFASEEIANFYGCDKIVKNQSNKLNLVDGMKFPVRWVGNRITPVRQNLVNYIVVIDTVNLKSYDYDSNKESRQNILKTIYPDGSVDGTHIIKHHANEIIYIAMDNGYEMNLKNIRCRVLSTDYKPISIITHAELTLLIKEPID